MGLLCLLAVIAASSSLATTVTYARGSGAPGVFIRSVGIAQRTENWTYHTAGYYWCSEYNTTGNWITNNGVENGTGLACSTSNPLHNTNGIGYGYVWTSNGSTEGEDILWTANSNNT